MRTEKGGTRLDYDTLVAAIGQAHQQTQAGVAGAVNRYLLLRNWIIGAYLVEYEQNGRDRATYGSGLLKTLSKDLREQEIPGCSVRMLERMRVFYNVFPQMREAISSPPVTISLNTFPISELEIPSSPVPEPHSIHTTNPQPLPVHMLLRLSWTHLVDLLAIDDPWKRAFYENECLNGNWSKRQLQRQIGSLLYERTGLSTDKQAVIEAGRKQAGEMPQSVSDLIRDP